MSDERIVEVMARAVKWFDFGEPSDTAESLSRVILAQLRAKGYDVVPEAVAAPGVGICVVHLAPRALPEDPTVCWNYDGGDDCRFTSVHPVEE